MGEEIDKKLSMKHKQTAITFSIIRLFNKIKRMSKFMARFDSNKQIFNKYSHRAYTSPFYRPLVSLSEAPHVSLVSLIIHADGVARSIFKFLTLPLSLSSRKVIDDRQALPSR